MICEVLVAACRWWRCWARLTGVYKQRRFGVWSEPNEPTPGTNHTLDTDSVLKFFFFTPSPRLNQRTETWICVVLKWMHVLFVLCIFPLCWNVLFTKLQIPRMLVECGLITPYKFFLLLLSLFNLLLLFFYLVRYELQECKSFFWFLLLAAPRSPVPGWVGEGGVSALRLSSQEKPFNRFLWTANHLKGLRL